jgi:hypothetical protein
MSALPSLPLPPQALPDDELAHLCRPRAWERAPRAVSIALALTIVAVLVVAGDPAAAAVAGVLAVAFLAVLLVVLFVSALEHLLPLAVCRRELELRKFRAGVAIWAAPDDVRAWSRRLLDETPRIVGQPFRDGGEVEWLVIVRERALPHGFPVHVRVLVGHGRAGTVLVGFRRAIVTGPDRPPWPSVHATLLPEEDGAILALLESFPEGFGPMAEEPIKDGCPCDLAICRREPREDALLSFNLSGLKDRSAPPAALAKVLSEAAQRVLRAAAQ